MDRDELDLRNERIKPDSRKAEYSCLYRSSDGSWKILGSFSSKKTGILSRKPIKIPALISDLAVEANIRQTIEDNSEALKIVNELEPYYLTSIDYVNHAAGRTAVVNIYNDGDGFVLSDTSLPGRLRYSEGSGGNCAYATDPSDLEEEIFRLTLGDI